MIIICSIAGGTGTQIAAVDDTGYSVQATYRDALSPKEANTLFADPLFVDTLTSDFHLQKNSPAINVGADLSSVFTTDYAGTARPQGSTFDMGAYEYIPLTVTINQAAGQADPTNSTINFTVVFSESVSDFATGDVTLSGTAGATTATVTPVGPATTYNVAVTGMTGSGTVIATIAADKATGATGNNNETSTSTDNTVTYDITPPTLTSITISDTSGYTNSSTPTITIVSSGSPSHVAFSCNGGTNWSDWITYDTGIISSFNITNGATGCTTSDGSKTITAKLKDAAGNESSTANKTTYYDTTAPTLSVKTTFSGWYTANQTSTFTYTDGSGSGIASGTPVTCIISTEGSAQTCSVTPNVCDAASNCNTTLVTSNGANIDKTFPANGSVGYTNGYFTSTSVPLTVDDGTDGGSGINTATRTFQRQSASLLLGICGIYDSFSPITPSLTVAYPNFTDTTVVSGNCYKYEYQVSDAAGNQSTYTSENAARIDTSNPSAPGIPSTTTPTNSTSQTWTWDAATDAISDVANYLWRTTGTAITNGTTAVTNVVTNLAEGVYNFFVKTVDNAGNQGAESSGTLTVDTTAPTITSASAGTPTSTGTTITWTTNEDSSSKVDYGLTTSYGTSTTETDTPTGVTSHSVALSSLSSCTTYHYRVKSIDTALNETIDSDNTFITAGCTSSSSSSTSISSSTSAPSCGDQAPGAKAPWLYGAIAQDSGSVLLYFTEADNPVNKYVLEYGTKSGDHPYGVQDMGVNSRGQMTYLVKSLSPNTTYYFKVRGGNGCATGTWSNEISAKTKSNIAINQLNFTSSTLETIPAQETQPTTINESCQTYTVKSGDTLWSIAENLLGDGNKYKEIIDQNKEKYLSLENSNSVVRGWELRVNCGNQTTTETPKPTQTETKTQAGYDVKVKVVDTDKKPIEGATVTLHSTPQTTKTDKSGVALFHNVEQGYHKVLIAYNNFEGEQSINLTGNVKEFDLNVTVQQKSIALSPLAVGIIGVMGLVIISLIVLLIKNKRRE